MKKRVAILLLTLMVMSLLAACGSGEVIKDSYYGTYEINVTDSMDDLEYLAIIPEDDKFEIYDTYDTQLYYGNFELTDEGATLVTEEDAFLLTIEDEKYYLTDLEGSKIEVTKVSDSAIVSDAE